MSRPRAPASHLLLTRALCQRIHQPRRHGVVEQDGHRELLQQLLGLRLHLLVGLRCAPSHSQAWRQAKVRCPPRGSTRPLHFLSLAP